MRFPDDIANSWKQVFILDIGSTSKGEILFKDEIEINGKYDCVLYGELYTYYNEHIETILSKTNKEIPFNSSTNCLIFPSSTTVNALSLISPSSLYNSNVILGGDMIIKKLNQNYDAHFTALSILKNKTKFAKLAQGSTIIHILSSNINKQKLWYPEIRIQKKISYFMSLIDKRIELQNKIIKDYKLLKKELNNKLFCQINNSTPKIRFKNFYEKWAKNKVKNIFESVTRGYALSKKDISTIKTNTFKYPVYSSQTLNNGLLGYYSNYLYENAITWTTDGANAGEVNFRKDKFYCTNVCGVLLSNNGYCNECMAAIINKVTKKFVSLVGNPKLMNNVMENIEIIFPSNIKEQLKISIFLSTIDKIIALYNDAINLYKKQKNFFLSKLFI